MRRAGLLRRRIVVEAYRNVKKNFQACEGELQDCSPKSRDGQSPEKNIAKAFVFNIIKEPLSADPTIFCVSTASESKNEPKDVRKPNVFWHAYQNASAEPKTMEVNVLQMPSERMQRIKKQLKCAVLFCKEILQASCCRWTELCLFK